MEREKVIQEKIKGVSRVWSETEPLDGDAGANYISHTEDRNKFFVALSNIIQVTPLFKKCLLEFFDFDPVRAWQCDKGDLINFSAHYPDITIPRNFLDQKKAINPDAAYETAMNSGGNFITIDDPDYPALLKEICDFPLVLYYKGNWAGLVRQSGSEIFNKTFAVVGSRRASDSAKIALNKIISEFSGTDITIVSGLAYGIDAAAHKAAIDAGLKTIGVIASGVNIIYPRSSKFLYDKIEAGSGLIFSEFPHDTPTLPHHFPQRNRIVTGLSYGTLVAEAALKSGAMISGNLTLEQGRELMCMPGLISNPNTEGVYKLLKDGATLVTNANDIFEALNWEITAKSAKIKLSSVEKHVFDIISFEPVSIEQIQLHREFEIAELMITLTGLELKGLIKQVNGKYFVTR